MSHNIVFEKQRDKKVNVAIEMKTIFQAFSLLFSPEYILSISQLIRMAAAEVKQYDDISKICGEFVLNKT